MIPAVPPTDKNTQMKTIKTAMIITMMVPAISFADDFKITLPIGSHHFGADSSYDYNEKNYGFGLEFVNFGAIWFKNSYHKNTYGLYYSLNTTFKNHITIGARIGALTGYERITGEKLSPVAMPFLGLKYDQHNLNFSVIPTAVAADSDVDAVLTLDYQYSF